VKRTAGRMKSAVNHPVSYRLDQQSFPRKVEYLLSIQGKRTRKREARDIAVSKKKNESNKLRSRTNGSEGGLGGGGLENCSSPEIAACWGGVS